jgi:ABC-type polysaccharide/polyol phosphate export permease
MRGTIPPLTQYASMAWCLVKARGHLYLVVVAVVVAAVVVVVVVVVSATVAVEVNDYQYDYVTSSPFGDRGKE